MKPVWFSVLAVELILVTLIFESTFASEESGICASTNMVTMNRVFCNREPILLECMDTQFISKINNVNYGRTTDPHCANIWHPDDSKVITDCTDQSNAVYVMDRKCRFKESCRVGQKEINATDCGSGSRFVNVTYSCHEVIDLDNVTRTNEIHACQNESMKLTCAPSTITVSSATYGRTSPDLCYKSTVNTNALTCRAPNSLSVVESLCEHQVECSIEASDAQFNVNSSFCPDVYKYLEVKYFCG